MATDARDVLSLAMVKAELRINLAETAHDTLKSYEAWRVIVTRQLRLLPLAVIQEGSGAGGHPDHGHPDHVRRHPDRGAGAGGRPTGGCR